MPEDIFDNVLDMIVFSIPDIIRNIPLFKHIVSIYLFKSNDVNKSQIQAYLYISLVNKDIEYMDFEEYLQVVDMMFVEDVKKLTDIFEWEKSHKYDYTRCFRLKALRMLTGAIIVYGGESHVDKFYLTDMGRGLCNVVINNLNNKLRMYLWRLILGKHQN